VSFPNLLKTIFLHLSLLIAIPAFGSTIEMTSHSTPDASYVPLTTDMAQQELAIAGAPGRDPLPNRMAAASAMVHGASMVGLQPHIFTQATPLEATAASFPPLLSSLANAVSFIQGQMYAFPNGTSGLPSSFYVPPSLSGQILANNPDADRLIREGSDLYDTSLSIMALIGSGDMADAKKLIDVYTQPAYGTMDLRAEPNFNGHYNGGAFAPFGPKAFYLFDFVRASGAYQDPTAADPTAWQYYSPDTGDNAWMVFAIAQYVQQAEKNGASSASLQSYISLATGIGNGMVALQNPNEDPTGVKRDYTDAQGCIPSTPQGVYDASDHNYNPNDVCYVENNVSAYAALGALASIVTDPIQKITFQGARSGIASWLQNAVVYLPAAATAGRRLSGVDTQSLRPFPPFPPRTAPRPPRKQTGLIDPITGMFYQGIMFNPSTQHWEILTDSTRSRQPILATDSGGTWAISSLGPQLFGQIAGNPRAAYTAWSSVRQLMGWTATVGLDGSVTGMKDAGAAGRLDGLDYSNLYPENQSLISPEWTAGGVNAVKQLLGYYRDGAGKGQLSSDEIAGLAADRASMQDFISQNPNSYAVGPGLTGSRQGQTGFGWQCPPASVTAMASIYGVLPQDPLAWARSLNN